MTDTLLDTIKESLCWYDPRNPMFYAEESAPKPMEDGCACDACFYGRAELADRIIADAERIKRLEIDLMEADSGIVAERCITKMLEQTIESQKITFDALKRRYDDLSNLMQSEAEQYQQPLKESEKS